MNRKLTRSLTQSKLAREQLLTPAHLQPHRPRTHAKAVNGVAFARDPHVIVGGDAWGRDGVEEQRAVGVGDGDGGGFGGVQRCEAGVEGCAEAVGRGGGEGV